MLGAAARVQDSAAVLFSDTLVGRLPAGVHPGDTIIQRRFAPAPVVQFFFQQPPWLMWSGIVIAAVLAVVLLRRIWPRLPELRAWVKRWSRPAKVGVVGAVAAGLLIVGTWGYRTTDYVMNDSRFCTGCHIFMPPGQMVAVADTGDYTLISQLRGKHDTINCHSCHTFNALSEGRKMVLWMSGVRFGESRGKAAEAPTHGAVPRDICENCHKQGAARETWQSIAVTAGHRVHLESDSASGKLKSGSECLSCHATTAHVFQPSDSTCSQRGCHLTEETGIRLGAMARAGGLHCVLCHEFTREVPALATFDSASSTLRPGRDQCLRCHAMQQALPDFNPARDPHAGQCGLCHNPHEDAKPGEAVKSCEMARCHADWREEPFHLGAGHRKTREQCLTCHVPHAARVDASDCEGCHREVAGRTGRRPPLPFDTAAAKRRIASASHLDPPAWFLPAGPGQQTGTDQWGMDDGPPEDDPSGVRLEWPAAGVPAADSFPHPRHRTLSCITCHRTRSGHGGLAFEVPRGCDICHHQARAVTRCEPCHQPEERTAVLASTVTVAVRSHEPRTRTVPFSHELHGLIRCQECHTVPVSLAAPPEIAQCGTCHGLHHRPERTCATCHSVANLRGAHQEGLAGRENASHQRCDACHPAATVEELVPNRGFCLTCHNEQQTGHYPQGECAVCHLLSEPSRWRPRLSGTPPQ